MQRCASASTFTLTTSAACALGANLHAGAASAVPAGVCATVLQAAPSEPLAVAVARLVFCRMIAPGLIVTSARYVLRAAGLAAEPFLGSLPSCHLLPAPDHLSSLPRLLASVALRYGDVTIGNDTSVKTTNANTTLGASRRAPQRPNGSTKSPVCSRTNWMKKASSIVRPARKLLCVCMASEA